MRGVMMLIGWIISHRHIAKSQIFKEEMVLIG